MTVAVACFRYGAGWCGSWPSSTREMDVPGASGEGSGLRTESEKPAGIRARHDFNFTSYGPHPFIVRIKVQSGRLVSSWASLQFPRKCDDLSFPVAGFSSVTSDSWQRRRSVVPAAAPRKPRTRKTPLLSPHNCIPSSLPITSF